MQDEPNLGYVGQQTSPDFIHPHQTLQNNEDDEDDEDDDADMDNVDEKTPGDHLGLNIP